MHSLLYPVPSVEQQWIVHINSFIGLHHAQTAASTMPEHAPIAKVETDDSLTSNRLTSKALTCTASIGQICLFITNQPLLFS